MSSPSDKTKPLEIDSVIAAGFAKGWIAAYASAIDRSYDHLMRAAKDYLDNGDYLEFESAPTTDSLFWVHYETITGTPLLDRHPDFFMAAESNKYPYSCAC